MRKSSGYGAYSLKVGAKKIHVDVHRYICELAHGAPSEGQYALHCCDNRKCVNKRHLRWGSHRDNMREASARRRMIGGGRYRQRLFTDEIRYIVESGKSVPVLAREFGMSIPYIAHVRRKALSK